MVRPYVDLTIDELEALFARDGGDRELLKQLHMELLRRRPPSERCTRLAQAVWTHLRKSPPDEHVDGRAVAGEAPPDELRAAAQGAAPLADERRNAGRSSSPLMCEACGRGLAGETAFCPYCGADRLAPAALAAPETPPPPAPPEPSLAPPPAPTSVPVAAATPVPRPTTEPRPDSAPPTSPAPPEPRKRRRRGCATPLLVVLLAVLAGVSWCALHRPPTAGAPAVAGASAARPLHVSRRWRTVRLPGDAPASARFAVSSDTALRVRAGGQLFVVRPRHPLRLPDDAGDSFDVRTADYVSSDDAARAKAALITLGG